MRVHEQRRERMRELEALDPDADWLEIYRRLTLWELPAEARFGFQLAFYRPLAVPRMASVLDGTGHLRRDTMKRAYDTGIVIHEIIWGGVESKRGQQMVRLLNKIHDRPGIYAQDMSYVLDCLVVVPTRFMDTYGWRRVTDQERSATWRFCEVLGRRMGIASRSTSYEDAERRLGEYEAEHLAASSAGVSLTQVSVRVLAQRLPRPVRSWAPELTSALVNDPAVAQALGLPSTSRGVSAVLRSAAALRRVIERRRPPSADPSFWPGRPAGDVYPHGYQLSEAGPSGA